MACLVAGYPPPGKHLTQGTEVIYMPFERETARTSPTWCAHLVAGGIRAPQDHRIHGSMNVRYSTGSRSPKRTSHPPKLPRPRAGSVRNGRMRFRGKPGCWAVFVLPQETPVTAARQPFRAKPAFSRGSGGGRGGELASANGDLPLTARWHYRFKQNHHQTHGSVIET